MVNHLVANIVDSILGKGKPTARGNQSYHCPFCHHSKPKLEVNFNEGGKGAMHWHCWVCNKRGKNIVSLLKQVDAPYEKIEEVKKHTNYKGVVFKEKPREKIQLPKEYKPLLSISKYDLVGRKALAYVKKRGITKDDILKYNLGYCDGGKFDQMIIIPSYDNNGELNYFSSRNFNPNSPVSYKNPPVSRDIIPFELFINWSSPLILCEGPFDALAIKRNALPLLGKNIQKELMKKIVTSEVEKIYLVLDKDAQKQSLKFCDYLLKEGKEVYLVDLQEKDPGEMGFEKITKLIQETLPIDQYQLLSKKLELL